MRAALPRLDTLIGEGVTTLEIKSGYGLDAASETKMLRAQRRALARNAAWGSCAPSSARMRFRRKRTATRAATSIRFAMNIFRML